MSHRSGYSFNYTFSGFYPNEEAAVTLGFAENYAPNSSEKEDSLANGSSSDVDVESLQKELDDHEASLDILNRRVRPFLVDNHRRRKLTL